MLKGIVNRILPFSSVDGPGNRTVIFLQGCNYNCLYCHNPETIKCCSNCGLCMEHCPKGAITLEKGKIKWDSKACIACDRCLKECPHQSTPKAVLMSIEDAVNEIRKWQAFISGITISGGECTVQADFITALCREARNLGLTAFLEKEKN